MFTPWRSGARSQGTIAMSAMVYWSHAMYLLSRNLRSTTP
jgi:hypothetical protein